MRRHPVPPSYCAWEQPCPPRRQVRGLAGHRETAVPQWTARRSWCAGRSRPALRVLVLILLIFGVRGCLNSRKDRAFRDYAADVRAIVGESNDRPPTCSRPSRGPRNAEALDVQNEINALATDAEQLVERARGHRPPGRAERAPRTGSSPALEFRRDALKRIAPRIPTALGDRGAKPAIERIAGQMQAFLASDVIYSQRATPAAAQRVRRARHRGALPQPQSLPDLGWLDPETIETRLCRIGNTERAATPGIHGTGLQGVTVKPAGTALTRDGRQQASRRRTNLDLRGPGPEPGRVGGDRRPGHRLDQERPARSTSSRRSAASRPATRRPSAIPITSDPDHRRRQRGDGLPSTAVPGERVRDNNTRHLPGRIHEGLAVRPPSGASELAGQGASTARLSFRRVRRPDLDSRHRRARRGRSRGRSRSCSRRCSRAGCAGSHATSSSSSATAASATSSRTRSRFSSGVQGAARAGPDARSSSSTAARRRGAAARPLDQPLGRDPLRRLQRDERPPVELDRAARRHRHGRRDVVDPPSRAGTSVRQGRARAASPSSSSHRRRPRRSQSALGTGRRRTRAQPERPLSRPDMPARCESPSSDPREPSARRRCSPRTERRVDRAGRRADRLRLRDGGAGRAGRACARADRELARGIGQRDARRARVRDRGRSRSSASSFTRSSTA